MRVVRVVAALITVLGLVPAGGCGSSDTPPPLREQLVAGIHAVNAATFRTVGSMRANTVSNTTEGVGDPGRRAMRLKRVDTVAGKTTTVETVAFGSEVYLRFEGSPVPGLPAGTWLRLDVGRLPSTAMLGVDPDDLTGKLSLVPAITSIERTGAHELRGTLDLSKAAGALPGSVADPGDTGRRSRWQARFDGDRLVWMLVTVPRGDGLPDVTIETAYSGFGEPVTVERPPAGGTVPAPESLYKVLGR